MPHCRIFPLKLVFCYSLIVWNTHIWSKINYTLVCIAFLFVRPFIHQYMPNTRIIFANFKQRKLVRWFKQKRNKKNWMNEWFYDEMEIFGQAKGSFIFILPSSHTTFFLFFVFFPLHFHIFGRYACAYVCAVHECVCLDCVMTKLSHFIQFSCVWTLNIHLDGLSVILFFYYISDNNAILKIFSNSVLFLNVYVQRYNVPYILQIYISCVFSSQIIESKIWYEVNSTCFFVLLKEMIGWEIGDKTRDGESKRAQDEMYVCLLIRRKRMFFFCFRRNYSK